MIKRLKRRFVLVNMLILFCILLVTFVSIFLMMYNSEITISEQQMIDAVNNKRAESVEGYVEHDTYMNYMHDAPPNCEGDYNYYGYYNMPYEPVPWWWNPEFWNGGWPPIMSEPQEQTDVQETQCTQDTIPAMTTPFSKYKDNNVYQTPPSFPKYETEIKKEPKSSETVKTPENPVVTTVPASAVPSQPIDTYTQTPPSPVQETVVPAIVTEAVTTVPTALEKPVETQTQSSAVTVNTENEAVAVNTEDVTVTTAVTTAETSVTEQTTTYNNGLKRNNIVVRLDRDKRIKRIDYNSNQFYNDTTINDDAVITAVNGVFKENGISGKAYISDSKYRYKLFKDGEIGFDLVFVDMSIEISTLERLLFIFMIIAGFGLIVVFIVSLILANWAIKPVENAWNKQKQFVADASHELKTPLSVISTNADVVMSNPDDYVKNQGKWLNYIKSETFRMSKLVSEMLYIAKSDANQINLTMSDINLSDVISSVCLVFEPTVFENGKTLSTCIAPNIELFADEDRIRQLITILIDNAIKHSLPNSNITVTMRLNKQNKVKLCVSNESIDIPKNKLNKIFDRFYRIDDSRCRNTGGNGLGLNIAQTIVNYHNGNITAQCDNGIIMFTVTF